MRISDWISDVCSSDLRWLDDLAPAREEVGALIRAIDDGGSGEIVEVLAANESAVADAEAALRGTRARVHHAPFGDIWLRDTGPLFVRCEGGLTAADFGFNGWGGKYDLPTDDTIAAPLARLTHTPPPSHDRLLEGGA